MFRKLFESKQIPNKQKNNMTTSQDVLGHICTFLTVNELPNVSRVSKEWSNSTTTQVVRKNMVLNALRKGNSKLDVSKYEKEAENQNKKIDWKKFYIKYNQYKYANNEHEEIVSIRNAIQQMEEINHYAVLNGGEPTYGITRKDTCAAGCCGCFLCGGSTYLITFFACKEVSGIFACFYAIAGFNFGFWGRTYQLQRRARSYQEGNLAEPLLNDVTSRNEEEEYIEEKENQNENKRKL